MLPQVKIQYNWMSSLLLLIVFAFRSLFEPVGKCVCAQLWSTQTDSEDKLNSNIYYWCRLKNLVEEFCQDWLAMHLKKSERKWLPTKEENHENTTFSKLIFKKYSESVLILWSLIRFTWSRCSFHGLWSEFRGHGAHFVVFAHQNSVTAIVLTTSFLYRSFQTTR